MVREGKNYARKSGHGEKRYYEYCNNLFHGYRWNIASLRNHNCSLQIILSVVINMNKNIESSKLGTTQKYTLFQYSALPIFSDSGNNFNRTTIKQIPKRDQSSFLISPAGQQNRKISNSFKISELLLRNHAIR